MNFEHGILCAGQSALTLKLHGQDGVYSNVSCSHGVIRQHPFMFFGHSYVRGYRNTIAGLPPSERIFFFWKNKLASQKLNFSILFFRKKVSIKMILNSLVVKKCCKN